jgi:hypothetical protein
MPVGRYRVHLRGEGSIRSGLVQLKGGVEAVHLEDLDVQTAMASLEKGAAFDPRPYSLGIGTSIGRSAVDGFAPSPAFRVTLSDRFEEWVCGVADLDLGYATISSSIWTYQQLEAKAALGVDLVRWFGRFSLTAGGRLGISAVGQRGERSQSQRLSADHFGVATSSEGLLIGPRAGLSLGAEFHPFSRVGFRMAIEPGAWWLPAQAQVFPTDRTQGIDVGIWASVTTLVRL